MRGPWFVGAGLVPALSGVGGRKGRPYDRSRRFGSRGPWFVGAGLVPALSGEGGRKGRPYFDGTSRSPVPSSKSQPPVAAAG